MEQWSGQTAIVTGASSGIGRATCLRLAEVGMKVAALARRTDRLKELEREAAQKGDGVVKAVRCDISQEADVKAAFDWVDQNLGPVAVLVNNAGYLSPQTLSTAGDNTEVLKMFSTNVLGLVSCAREAAKRMKKSGELGHIINVNSIAGHTILPMPGIGPYTATKYGVTVLSEALRNELALEKSKIRVTSISPGLVNTEMAEPFKESLSPDTPILQSNDVADCVLFALAAPRHVNISEIKIQPTGETMCHIPQDFALKK